MALLILFFVILVSFSTASSESNDPLTAASQTFIIRVDNTMKPSQPYFSNVDQWYASILQGLTHKTPPSKPTQFIYIYRTAFHGFAARLNPQQVKELQDRPEILGVFPDRAYKLHTTRSPEFLGLRNNNYTSLNVDVSSLSHFGSNVIIGFLDSGIWPERRSFSDEGLDPIPTHWQGECQGGENFTASLCNKKLVGVRYMDETGFSQSARDIIGHGTHTASTAAGSPVENSSFLGYAPGVAAGIAPKARIAMYALGSSGLCSTSDIIAGFDKAVEDGVDVISISIGPSFTAPPLDEDPIAICSFAAMDKKGIIVSASGGNSGPYDSSVTNVAPWIITVGAGTIDRRFPADLLLQDGCVITGTSLYRDKNMHWEKSVPLIYAGSNCSYDSLDKDLMRGKIVVCDINYGSGDDHEGYIVQQAGGLGFVGATLPPGGGGLISEAPLLPGLTINESSRQILLDYISSDKNPQAKMDFRGTLLGFKPAPIVATFSSRGPNPLSDYVMKPDVIAPGVDILAAWTGAVSPTEIPDDPRRTEFNVISGTSMSCPHVSGIAALLKGAHPDWSPAMIKSAIMTSAYTVDRDGQPILDETDLRACTANDMGSGHVDPQRAVDPGLVYDLTSDDYVEFLCASNLSEKQIKAITQKSVNCSGAKPAQPWNLNYPAISVAFNGSVAVREIAVERRVTYVGNGTSRYDVRVKSPNGTITTVDPQVMEFNVLGESMSYVVRISSEKASVTGGSTRTEFGQVTWTDNAKTRHVTSPIMVTWY